MSQPRITARQLKELALLRIEEAATLLRGKKQQGTYYLCGYAVECALKAIIAAETRRNEFPPAPSYVRSIYTHDLEELLALAGLKDKLDAELKRNPALAANWGVVKLWNESSRYALSGLTGKDMYRAVSDPDGVLQWIQNFW
jgi:HEPN domain-containing protein